MNIKKFTLTKSIYIVLISIFMSSCVSNSGGKYKNLNFNVQDQIVNSAIAACNKKYTNTLTFNNREFNNDCSGLIYGIFWESGIDLMAETSSKPDSGVKKIYEVIKRKRLLHKHKIPNPGDLIFWNNTYGKWGKKPLSHIGVVISVDKSTGQIVYVHNNTYLGDIKKETMNLYKPHETQPNNSYMRYDSKYKKTSAELFDSFGMAWKL